MKCSKLFGYHMILNQHFQQFLLIVNVWHLFRWDYRSQFFSFLLMIESKNAYQ
jgi:hypothetical protein